MYDLQMRIGIENGACITSDEAPPVLSRQDALNSDVAMMRMMLPQFARMLRTDRAHHPTLWMPLRLRKDVIGLGP